MLLSRIFAWMIASVLVLASFTCHLILTLMSSLYSCLFGFGFQTYQNIIASSHIPNEGGDIMAPLDGRTVEMLEMRALRGLGMDHSRPTCNYVRGPFFLPLAIKHPNLVACMISDRSIQIATLVEDLERRKNKESELPKLE